MTNTSKPSTAVLAQVLRAHGDGEVSARWASVHRDDFRLVDVREPHELEGPLGHIEGVENVPLLELLGGGGNVVRDAPLVLVCRSGRRSSIAADALRNAGVQTVASIEGGMLAWNLDVEGRTSVIEDERTANVHNLADAIQRANGLPEVSAEWVNNNVGRFRLFDIREDAELSEFGRVAQSEHIPMQTFLSRAGEFDRDAPLVVMCASGGRSGRVVRALEAAGFSAVASMEGGMFGWRAQGLPAA